MRELRASLEDRDPLGGAGDDGHLAAAAQLHGIEVRHRYELVRDGRNGGGERDDEERQDRADHKKSLSIDYATSVALQMQRVQPYCGRSKMASWTRMIRIIGSFVSPYVRKVLACMNLKGLTYEVDPITPFYGNEEFER